MTAAKGQSPRPPSLLGSVATFVLAGPFVAGLVGVIVLATLGGDPTARVDGEPSAPLKVLSFGVRWFRSVFTQPTGWFLTLGPTVLAAVLFWALSRPQVPLRS